MLKHKANPKVSDRRWLQLLAAYLKRYAADVSIEPANDEGKIYARVSVGNQNDGKWFGAAIGTEIHPAIADEDILAWTAKGWRERGNFNVENGSQPSFRLQINSQQT